ncbi:hypothetical protein Bca4012_008028 [Brassica carinata]
MKLEKKPAKERCYKSHRFPGDESRRNRCCQNHCFPEAKASDSGVRESPFPRFKNILNGFISILPLYLI